MQSEKCSDIAALCPVKANPYQTILLQSASPFLPFVLWEPVSDVVIIPFLTDKNVDIGLHFCWLAKRTHGQWRPVSSLHRVKKQSTSAFATKFTTHSWWQLKPSDRLHPFNSQPFPGNIGWDKLTACHLSADVAMTGIRWIEWSINANAPFPIKIRCASQDPLIFTNEKGL